MMREQPVSSAAVTGRIRTLATGSAVLAGVSGVLFLAVILLVCFPGREGYQWRPPFVWGRMPAAYFRLFGGSVAALAIALLAVLAGHGAFLASVIRARRVLRSRGALWTALFSISLIHLAGVPIVLAMSLINHGAVVAALFATFGLIAAGHVAFVGAAMKDKQRLNLRGLLWRGFSGIYLGSLVAVLIALPIGGFFSKWRYNMDGAACGDNLKRLGILIQLYAREHRGMFPPLASQPGLLMFSPEAIVPDEDVLRALTCPTVRYAAKGTKGYDAARSERPIFGDHSYYYLGYAVLDDDDVEAFARAYRKQIAEGDPFDKNLLTEEGRGTRVLHRLQENVKYLWKKTGDPHAVSPFEGHEGYGEIPEANFDRTSDIPVFIERRVEHIYTDWDTRPRHAHVYYLNDGVRSVEYGTWPLTEKTLRILEELSHQHTAGAQ